MEIRTNRDLYLAVCGLKKVHGQKNVDLQSYLERVLISSCVFRTREELTLDELFGLLESGFHEKCQRRPQLTPLRPVRFDPPAAVGGRQTA